MFDNLQICIPSRSRWGGLRTIHSLSQHLWPQTTVFPPLHQFELYRDNVPGPVRVIPFDNEDAGIGAKRDFILLSSRKGKVIMMDDDLIFHKRTPDGTRFPVATQEQTIDMMKIIYNMLEEYPMVGLTDKFMSQTRPRGYVECHRFNQVLGINRELLPQPWPRFRIRHDEEHDFHLQLLTKGHKTAIITEWSKSDKAGAPGGCNDWRSPETLAQVHAELIQLWPGIVSITPDPPRARYNWKAAKTMGGIAV